MSCKTISSAELARTIPLSPPTVNRKIKPMAYSIAGGHLKFPPCRVANQLKTFTPVGIVADVKYVRVSTSIPTVNIRCAHTINPRKPIDIIAQTIRK